MDFDFTKEDVKNSKEEIEQDEIEEIWTLPPSGRMIALIIMDGFGISKETEGNAIWLAKKTVLDKLKRSCPNSTLEASGKYVGLPDGQMGNSEVGHTNIGAGRVIYQSLTRITKAIADGEFQKNEAILGAMNNSKENDTSFHIMGLVSDGGVHSHITHLYAILELAKKKGLKKVFLHCFLDGRDTPPRSALKYILELEKYIKELGIGKIATISGRYYAMDRDNRWDRIEKCYKAMVHGVSVSKFPSAKDAINNAYESKITDEFIRPTVLVHDGEAIAKISESDSVIFFNFRPDRARQITRSLVDPNFNNFKVKHFKTNFVCMMQYDCLMPNVKVAFLPESLENTFGEYISSLEIKQLRIAETEKYAHLTFFFNGGTEKIYKGEDRVMINSPKVPTYDIQPGMSAYELTDEACQRIKNKSYGVVIINFANCDMVGHTGNLEATIHAVEAVDFCLGKILNAIKSVNGIALITADHGNAETMIDPFTKVKHTAHTTNPVPIILYGSNNYALKSGNLCDIAPTMLELMGLRIPKEMTGKSLID